MSEPILTYLVGFVTPERNHATGETNDSRLFVQGFAVVEAADPTDAVGQVSENQTGHYVVLEADPRFVETMVVE